MLNLAQYNNQFSWQQGSKTDTERAVSWNGNYKLKARRLPLGRITLMYLKPRIDHFS
jgi:hypothetical protein